MRTKTVRSKKAINADQSSEEEEEEVEEEEDEEMDEEEEEEEELVADENPEDEVMEDVKPLRKSARASKFGGSMKEHNDREFVVRDDRKKRGGKDKGADNRKGNSKKGGPKKQQASKPSSPHKASRNHPRRQKVKAQIPVSSDSSQETYFSSEAEGEEDDEDDEAPMKIQRIIASKLQKNENWAKMMEKINTTEIESGSRWFQEADGKDDGVFAERFLVKWDGLSFLHCSWEMEKDLLEQIEGAKSYLKTFFRKSVNGRLYDADERADGEYFDPSFVQIDRILDILEPDDIGSDDDDEHDKRGSRRLKRNKNGSIEEKYGIVLDPKDENFSSGTGRQFLVKWGNTPYSECTYEFERDLILNEVEYVSFVEDFEKRIIKPNKNAMKISFQKNEEQMRVLYKIFGDKVKISDEAKEKKVKKYQKDLENHVFDNGGQLRDYQAEGVSWLMSNYINKRSSILADEMGLGKTIQTAIYINCIATNLHNRGPFLIIAPLSTIPHWHREFSGWTALNTFVYHGSGKDRELMREYEMAFPQDRPSNVGFNQSFLRKCHKKMAPKWQQTWMSQVVITTPEMLVTDDFAELAAVKWQLMVVDEAHRLKNHSSKLAQNLRDTRFKFEHILLLTGTPIQNNMNEMWTLLNIVDEKNFDDIAAFLERYGDIKSKERIDELHERIRPYILRRLKEDVEKSVPPKEETLIEVELTVLQKQFYRALYEKNVQFLHRNHKKALDGPSINNLAMQLRKCCNHPFLLRGVEDESRKQEKPKGGKDGEADFIVKASGKLVLLDKLLPRLKRDGHRVLIFSQFKIMLDILEDYLRLRDMKAERIDGSITGNKRQKAIDRFQAKDVEGKVSSFVMLLSTRAGGVGINLTAADTCIIFDSDWNPQNDLQAQARCHRIGQTKSVKVYRLLSRKSYEMQMFHMSSLKMGLDQAVLHGIENNGERGGGPNAVLSKEEVEKLLRHGAYDIFNEEKTGSSEKESNDFLEQDIDSIMERRTKTVVHENTGSTSSAAGGTFSKASFKASKPDSANGDGNAGEDVDIDDPDFWKKMVGEARTEDDGTNLVGKKRTRKKANYSEKEWERNFRASLMDEPVPTDLVDSASSPENSDFSDDDSDNKKRKHERCRWGGSSSKEWTKDDAIRVLKSLQGYGYGNLPWSAVLPTDFDRSYPPYDEEEVRRMFWALALLVFVEAVEDEVNEITKKANRAVEKKRRNDMILGKKVDPVEDPLVAQETKKRLRKEIFNKFLKEHKLWVAKAFEDAKSYSKGRTPRSDFVINTLLFDGPESERPGPDQGKSLPRLTVAFNENVWPALKSRGWVQETVADRKLQTSPKKPAPSRQVYVHGGVTYRSVSSVLAVAPSLHPELASTVETIQKSVAAEESTLPLENASTLEVESVTSGSLKVFLKKFAPLQLLVDRTRPTKILVPARKFVSILSSVLRAHELVQLANVKSSPCGNVIKELANLLSVDPRAHLPHPSWKANHDAVLVRAIAKHGWIDRESSCRAITEDSSIKWGPPFDEGDGKMSTEEEQPKITTREDPKTPQADIKLLKKVANRAASFFNAESESIEEMKGFNKALLIATYGLVLRTSDERSDEVATPENEQVLKKTWVVDEELLLQGLKKFRVAEAPQKDEPEGPTELPTRKDLLRRARIVLSRLSNNFPAAQEETTGASNMNMPQHESKSSSPPYSVLDQTKIYNTLLAELLRGLLKIASNKVNGQTLCRKLVSYASRELDFRFEEASAGVTNAISKTNEVSTATNGEKTVGSSEKEGTGAGGNDGAENLDGGTKKAENGLEEAKDDSGEAKGDPEEAKDTTSATEIKKISEHLQLFGRTVKTSPRQARNVIRVILGITPIEPKNPLDGRFPMERLPPLATSPAPVARLERIQAQQQFERERKRVQQQNNAIGDTAINRALAAASEMKRAELGGKPLAIDPLLLKLTATDVLLLSVMNSQGLPVWSHDWRTLVESREGGRIEKQPPGEEFVINWYKMGDVLSNAAKVWHNKAVSSLASKRFMLENDKTMSQKHIKKIRNEVSLLEADVDRKTKTIVDMADLESKSLAQRCIMLLEALRVRMGPVELSTSNNMKTVRENLKTEYSLGPKCLQWLSKEMARWAECLQISKEDGRPRSDTDDLGDNGEYVAAYLDKTSCRNVFIQIAQLTRLRAVFIRNGRNEMDSMVSNAVKSSRHVGDVWESCPRWWSSRQESNSCQDDLNLLLGIICFGFSGFGEVVKQNNNYFQNRLQESRNIHNDESMRRDVFTKHSVQPRINQLTRELSAQEDKAENMKLLSDCEPSKSKEGCEEASSNKQNSDELARTVSGNGAQTGIEAFFKSAAQGGPRSKQPSPALGDESPDGTNDDMDVVVVEDSEENTNGKRKLPDESVNEIDSSAPPEKKQQKVIELE